MPHPLNINFGNCYLPNPGGMGGPLGGINMPPPPIIPNNP